MGAERTRAEGDAARVQRDARERRASEALVVGYLRRLSAQTRRRQTVPRALTATATGLRGRRAWRPSRTGGRLSARGCAGGVGGG